MTNSIRMINPYKHRGQWVFDDPAVDLDKEPFVAGADGMIDLATSSIEDAENGFTMLFSDIPFPGHQIELNWVGAEAGGNVYIWKDTGAVGWLCPALLKYFDSPPKNIYVQVKEEKSAQESIDEFFGKVGKPPKDLTREKFNEDNHPREPAQAEGEHDERDERPSANSEELQE